MKSIKDIEKKILKKKDKYNEERNRGYAKK